MNQSSENAENLIDELRISRIDIIDDVENKLKIVIAVTIKFTFSNVSIVY